MVTLDLSDVTGDSTPVTLQDFLTDNVEDRELAAEVEEMAVGDVVAVHAGRIRRVS